MNLRQILFWIHLVTGAVSGVIIGVLCFTGTVLAFEKQLVAHFERDARRVEAPADQSQRLALDELQRRVREAFPDAKPTSIVVSRDPRAAVAFSSGRAGSVYANPYTGEVRRPESDATARFLQTMVTWHRYLGFSGETSRPQGKLVTGIANLAFTGLAITGLILWFPRSLSWRAFRPVIWFTQNTSPRARDWNRHNAIGFWTAPVLILLTLTAVPISFRWGGSIPYLLTGTPLPASGPESSGAQPAPATVPPAAPGAQALPHELLLQTVQTQLPNWQTISIRVASQPASEKPQPATYTVREARSWPRTATTTFQLDPFTGEILRRDGYAELSAARKVRAWSRFLHTGEAVGWVGQLIAGLATLGGCYLVYTGFSLVIRRFFGRPAASPRGPAQNIR